MEVDGEVWQEKRHVCCFWNRTTRDFMEFWENALNTAHLSRFPLLCDTPLNANIRPENWWCSILGVDFFGFGAVLLHRIVTLENVNKYSMGHGRVEKSISMVKTRFLSGATIPPKKSPIPRKKLPGHFDVAKKVSRKLVAFPQAHRHNDVS